jgi:hypothetical protein
LKDFSSRAYNSGKNLIPGRFGVGYNMTKTQNHPSYNAVRDDQNQLRSPRILASNQGVYAQRPKKTKISIYRNNSPIISKNNFYSKNKSNNFFPKKEYLKVNNMEQKSQNKSRFKLRKNKFIDEVTVKYSHIQRSVSHQITRKPSNIHYKRSTRRKRQEDRSNEKEKDRVMSPDYDNNRKTLTSFTSLSPKIKRRFGSVTVGKVIRKRPISRTYEKSSTMKADTHAHEHPLRR